MGIETVQLESLGGSQKRLSSCCEHSQHQWSNSQYIRWVDLLIEYSLPVN